MKLLWVEDNVRFARVAGREFLSGHEITLVPSLQAAREALRAWKFEGILLDFDLEDGKGSELMPDVQVLEPRPFIVAASAHTEGNTALLEAGADTACSKLEFFKIGSVLARAQAQREAFCCGACWKRLLSSYRATRSQPHLSNSRKASHLPVWIDCAPAW